VELGDHRSRLVTEASLRAADLVLVMDPRQARSLRSRFGFGDSLVLGDLDPEPVRRRPIRDPIFQPPDVFRRVYARIDRCVDGMLDALGHPTGEPVGAADPDEAAAGDSRPPTGGSDSA
jgi:protein-tyrosine-phosphatase